MQRIKIKNKFPWDDLIDLSYYKTNEMRETKTRYKICECE